MYRIIRKNNRWMVQKKSLIQWNDIKSFEVKLKAEKYIKKLQ